MSKSSTKAGQGKEAAAKDAKLDQYDAVSPDKRVVHASQEPGEGTGPVHFDYMKEKDKRRFMAKRILRGNDPYAASPYGIVHADKKDIKLLEDRLKNLQYAHKDEWISKHVDWTNPSSIAVWRQAAPDFWERRVEYLKKTIDVQAKLAMIVTKGFPTTPEEVELLYLVDTGQLRVEPQGPHMVAVKDPVGADITRGWLHNIMIGRNPAKMRSTGAALIQGLRKPTVGHPLTGAESLYASGSRYDGPTPTDVLSGYGAPGTGLGGLA